MRYKPEQCLTISSHGLCALGRLGDYTVLMQAVGDARTGEAASQPGPASSGSRSSVGGTLQEPAYSMVFESDASSVTSAAGLQEVRAALHKHVCIFKLPPCHALLWPRGRLMLHDPNLLRYPLDLEEVALEEPGSCSTCTDASSNPQCPCSIY